MKRIIVMALTALVTAGYASACFATDATTSTSVGVGKTGTDYYRHHRRHCHRCWYGTDNPEDGDSVTME